MGIPVVVVDDSKTDRYLVKRRLSRFEAFEEVLEEPAGDTFLENYFNGHGAADIGDRTLLVIMDINMPRMSGFETVEAMQKRRAEGKGPRSCVVLMFTSSENPKDLEKAKNFEIVKGYITKPLDNDDIGVITEIYNQF